MIKALLYQREISAFQKSFYRISQSFKLWETIANEVIASAALLSSNKFPSSRDRAYLAVQSAQCLAWGDLNFL